MVWAVNRLMELSLQVTAMAANGDKTSLTNWDSLKTSWSIHEMDVVELVCVIYFYSRNKQKKCNKRYEIHSLLETRYKFNQFANGFQELKKHEDTIFGYVRMIVSSFEESLIGHHQMASKFHMTPSNGKIRNFAIVSNTKRNK